MVKKKKDFEILLLELYDITEINAVDNDEILNKNPTIVKYVGFLHSETKEIYRMKNYFDSDSADILVIPKSLVINKTKLRV